MSQLLLLIWLFIFLSNYSSSRVSEKTSIRVPELYGVEFVEEVLGAKYIFVEKMERDSVDAEIELSGQSRSDEDSRPSRADEKAQAAC